MKSMTAYAQKSLDLPQGSLHWVIRSFNHRYLDCQFRLPDDFRHLENPLRQRLKERLARGKIEANLHFNPDPMQVAQSMSLNPALAQQLRKILSELDQSIDDAKVDLAHLLHWPGLIDHQQMDMSGVYEATITLMDETLEEFIQARSTEGEAIRGLLLHRLDGIEHELLLVKAQAPNIQSYLKSKIAQRLEALGVDVDAGRMEQEVALLLQKSDVDEELDRLDVHVAEFRRIIDTEEACGRRLDFLVQELNREANTLASKATLVETSQASVQLKVFIEQIREQIQNIE
jgi:uncharacterized protein (TIGR00255 family)